MPTPQDIAPPVTQRRVESKLNFIKLLGQSLMPRDFERQVAELQVLIAVPNGYTALGIPVTVPVGRVRPEEGHG